MTNSTFELEDLPDVPGGTWKIINCSNDSNREAPFVIKLEVEGQAPIEVGIPTLDEFVLLSGAKHAYSIYQSKAMIPGLQENDEVSLLPKSSTED